ncbi:hypothetical protein KTO58_15710 [Chitinophaga pendula]|uniref:hypothetical protein n=1 Tax=Chitinophaga TaxID=79328 RepID=UPI000BAF881D|nr:MULTISPECIES: hypothetical protein [Chitinophaga]ASZ11834.1 hypothetical protein CK934_13130 [Chitinophaga sp. MD30]UCJ05141.1 hypothetical protein KTO58_15710 [Chitinophaga pendula]
MDIFHIDYNNTTVKVEHASKDRFVIHLPGKRTEIILKQDNEGANHWFEDGSDNETPESHQLGVAIETYLAKKS